MTIRGMGSTAPDTSNLALDTAAASDGDEEAPLSHCRVKAKALYKLLLASQEEVLLRACAKTALRCGRLPTKRSFDAGIALFTRQLCDALGSATLQPDRLRQVAARHGRASLHRGITISQVVYCYGDVCQVLLELALERALPVAVEELRIVSYCLDEARASAVAAYEETRAQQISRRDTRDLQQVAAALSNSLATAVLAFGGIKRGSALRENDAGAVLLDRSLRHLQRLVDRSLARVRARVVDRHVISENLRLGKLAPLARTEPTFLGSGGRPARSEQMQPLESWWRASERLLPAT